MPVASWTAGRGAAAGEVLAVALDAVDGSIRLHKAPACALRASLCSRSPPFAVNKTRGSILPRKIELLEADPHRAIGSTWKAWNDARSRCGGERLAIGTMYPGGIPGPGLIFEA